MWVLLERRAVSASTEGTSFPNSPGGSPGTLGARSRRSDDGVADLEQPAGDLRAVIGSAGRAFDLDVHLAHADPFHGAVVGDVDDVDLQLREVTQEAHQATGPVGDPHPKVDEAAG